MTNVLLDTNIKEKSTIGKAITRAYDAFEQAKYDELAETAEHDQRECSFIIGGEQDE